MNHTELRMILRYLANHLKDNPSLQRPYDELLEAYHQTQKKPDWRIPIMPQIKINCGESEGER